MSWGFLSATKFPGITLHRAILQSGNLQTGLSVQDADWLAEEYARALEVPVCSLETVGKTSGAVLLAAQNRVIRGKKCGLMPFQPTVDGDLLEDRIVNRWKAGAAKDLNMMIGYTRNEELLFLKIFAPNYLCPTEEALLKRVTSSLSPLVMGVPDHEAAAKRAVEEIKAWDGGATPPTHADMWTYKAVDFTRPQVCHPYPCQC